MLPIFNTTTSHFDLRKVITMKKLCLALGLFGLASVAAAADPLNGTLWRAIDDKTGKPKAVVKFTEQNNGTLSASIQQVLTLGEENACSKCQGQYKINP